MQPQRQSQHEVAVLVYPVSPSQISPGRIVEISREASQYSWHLFGGHAPPRLTQNVCAFATHIAHQNTGYAGHLIQGETLPRADNVSPPPHRPCDPLGGRMSRSKLFALAGLPKSCFDSGSHCQSILKHHFFVVVFQGSRLLSGVSLASDKVKNFLSWKCGI